MKRYIVLSETEAQKLGLDCWWGSGHDFCQAIYRCDDNGKATEFIGCDGGEPEDQTLSRDWKWVVDALNAAEERGEENLLVEFEEFMNLCNKVERQARTWKALAKLYFSLFKLPRKLGATFNHIMKTMELEHNKRKESRIGELMRSTDYFD